MHRSIRISLSSSGTRKLLDELGDAGLVGQGFERLMIDVGIIWATGALIVAWKQRFVHKRKPLV